ncbi:PREDICTED: uncharacterized protein LOC106746502 isoform X2 [Dinoponera quadriceps]|nr:PREDICTED: uncharacterized protein LOC106746502 isoform X2 [Dinoponera quadriceps]
MYGGECTYEVFIISVIDNYLYASIKSDFKCRLKAEDTLSCRFQNKRIRHTYPLKNETGFVPTIRFVGGEPFEIHFNLSGVQYLVVHKTIPKWQLDMIKVIVSQLNDNFETARRYPQIIEIPARGNSTVGECEVNVTLGRTDKKHDDDDDDEEDGSGMKESEDFELGFVWMHDNFAQTNGKFRIKKIQQLKGCPQRTIYFFFRKRKDDGRSDGALYIDMIYSTNYITITKNHFMSRMEMTGVMNTAIETQGMQLKQMIDLKLRRIDLTRDSLPEIRNPTSISL